MGIYDDLIPGKTATATKPRSTIYDDLVAKPKTQTPSLLTTTSKAPVDFKKITAATVVKPADSTTSGVIKNTIKELGNPENLPLGVGAVVKQLHEDPITAANLTAKDFLAGTIETGKDYLLKYPLQVVANLAMQPMKFNIPGLGEITNRQFSTAQRINNGEDTATVLAEEGSGAIFDTLFLVGMGAKVFGGRPVTIAKGTLPSDSGITVKQPAKTGRLYEEPTGTTPIPPEFVQRMATEKGVDLGPKYDPALPTYFRMTGKANGNIVGEVVQIKPSYFKTFLNVLKGDTSKVPPEQTTALISRETSLKALEQAKPVPVPTTPITPQIPQVPATVVPSAVEQARAQVPQESAPAPAVAPSENTTLYHGTDTNVSADKLAIAKDGSPIWLSKTQAGSERYGANIIPVQLKGANLLDETTLDGLKQSRLLLEQSGASSVKDPVFQQTLKDAGYDGIIAGNGNDVMIFNPKVLSSPPVKDTNAKPLAAKEIPLTKKTKTEWQKAGFKTQAEYKAAQKDIAATSESDTSNVPARILAGKITFKPSETTAAEWKSVLGASYYKVFKKNAASTVDARASELGYASEDEMRSAVADLVHERSNKKGPQKSRATARSADALFSKGATPIDKFESRIGEPVKETPPATFKLYKKMDELIKKYATRVGEGYLPRNAKGVYYHNTTNIRLSGMNDLSVASHEITHRLDMLNKISEQVMKVEGFSKTGNPIYEKKTAIFRKELTDMYVNHYPGGNVKHKLKLRMLEGYATLLQKYVEMPTTIKQNYPNLVREMLSPGGRFYHPVIGEIIADLKGIVKDYQELQPLDKVGARVTSDLNPTGKDSFLTREESIITIVADEVFPHEKIAKVAGVGMTSRDPSLHMRRYKGLSSIFARNTTPGKGYWGFNKAEGAFTKIHDFNWGDIQKSLAQKQLNDQFGFYLVARDQYFNFQELPRLKENAARLRAEVEDVGVAEAKTLKNDEGVSLYDEYKMAVKSYQELKEELRNNGFSEHVVKDAYLQNKEKFTEEEARFDVLTHEDLKMWHDVGRISDKQFEILSSKEGYASLKRQFYDEIAGDAKVKGKGVGKTPGAMKHRTGSMRTIIDPVLNGIVNHAEITRKAMKQHIENLMAEAANTALLPEVFQKVDVIRSRDANTGVITYPQEKDPQILMGFLNGDHKARVAFIMDSELKNSLDKILTVESAGFFGKLATGANRLFVKGTTGAYPAFTLTNVAMDQVTLASQTRHNVVPLYGPLSALYKALSGRNDVVARRLQEYLANGGELHTLVGWQNLSAKELVAKITHEREGILRMIDWADKGLDIASFPAKWSEIASRFAEYNAAQEAGDSIIVASEKAANVTVSFHKMGSFSRLGSKGGHGTQVWVKSIPFMNPGVQALYTMYRAGLKSGPRARNRLLLVILAILAAQLAEFGYLNARGTQKQKDLYMDLAPEELGGYLWFPHSDGETLGKIRLPSNLNVIGMVANMALADHYWGADYSGKDYLAGATAFLPAQANVFKPGQMALSWIPQAAKIPIMVVANKRDFPSIRDLESQTQMRKEPGQRSTPSTPVALKWIGEKYNISPIKMEYILTGVVGRASGFLTGKPGVYNPLSVLNKDYYFESGRRVQQYYDVKKTNDQQYNTFKNNPDSLTEVETDRILEQHAALGTIDNLLTAYGKIDPVEDKQGLEDSRLEILALIKEL